jgi:hypothetical protein
MLRFLNSREYSRNRQTCITPRIFGNVFVDSVKIARRLCSALFCFPVADIITAADMGKNLKWRLFRARLVFENLRSRAFDKRHHVETAREERLAEMGVGAEDIQRGNSYYRVTWGWLIKKAMAKLDIDHRRYSFIDYGSGKGKAMLMASDYPFKTIIGLEYAKRLHDIATENCRTYCSVDQKCHSLEQMLGDVMEYTPPPGPIVCFMCNPFDEATLRTVFNIWRARYEGGEREIRILYLNMRDIAEMSKVLEEQSWLAPLARNRRFVVLAPKANMAPQ